MAELTPVWSLLPGRGVWIDVSDEGKFVCTNSAMDIFTGDGKGWMDVPGKAKSISIGNDGDMWCVNKDDTIYHWGAKGWEKVAGAANQISVGNKSHIVCVNDEGNVYLREGDKWKHLPGKLKNASIASDGELWGTNEDADIYRFSASENKWHKQSGKAVMTAVVRNGSVYCINSEDNLYHMNNNDGKWIRHPGLLNQIAVNSHGVLVGSTDDHKLYVREPVASDKKIEGKPEYKAPPAIAAAVAAHSVEAPVSQLQELKIQSEYASNFVMSLVGKSVAFRTHQGKFLCAEQDGRLVGDRAEPKQWEHFSIIGVDSKDAKHPKVHIKSAHGKYLCSDNGKAVINRDAAKEWELWTLVELPGNKIALRDYKNKYLCVEGPSNIPVNRDEAKEWEALVPQVRLSQDEAAVAQHYGRGIAFKTAHGKFLCAEPSGVLVANRDDAKEWETFTVTRVTAWNPHSPLNIRSHHGKYLCSEDNKAVVNRDAAREWEQWTMVPLGGHHVALRDYRGKFLCVEPSGAIVVNRPHAREWETLTLVAK
jgi:hypothetical protein